MCTVKRWNTFSLFFCFFPVSPLLQFHFLVALAPWLISDWCNMSIRKSDFVFKDGYIYIVVFFCWSSFLFTKIVFYSHHTTQAFCHYFHPTDSFVSEMSELRNPPLNATNFLILICWYFCPFLNWFWKSIFTPMIICTFTCFHQFVYSFGNHNVPGPQCLSRGLEYCTT